MNGFIGTERVVSDVVNRGNGSIWYRMKGVDDFYFVSDVMKRVDDKKVACILTEKVLVGDVPCRKILGFEGILGREELPKKYLEGKPRFLLANVWMHRKLVNGVVVLGRENATGPHDDSNLNGISFDIPTQLDGWECTTHFCIGDVIPEKIFQELLTWLKRAGSRLAKIRKQEKAAWSGKETIEI